MREIREIELKRAGSLLHLGPKGASEKLSGIPTGVTGWMVVPMRS